MSARRFPDGNAYVEALQNAENIRDAELRAGRYERRNNGLPKPYSGGFTTTFHFETSSGNFAVRCFTRGSNDLQRRYHAITDFLRLVRNPTFCQAEYHSEGIRVESSWWPIIKMDWISGPQLNTEVEAKLGNSTAILELAINFRKMVRELGVLGVAHGDLQHGNIIVHRGMLRLIDYDGIFLPALYGMAASEFGHRNYQHPGRSAAPFDGRLDRFSSILIYTALVALASEPSLWQQFNNDENMLFRASDLTSGGASPLFAALLKIPTTQHLASDIIDYLHTPCEQIPTLEQALQNTKQSGKRYDDRILRPQGAYVPPQHAADQKKNVNYGATVWTANAGTSSATTGSPSRSQPYRPVMQLRPGIVSKAPANTRATRLLAALTFVTALALISATTYFAMKATTEVSSTAISLRQNSTANQDGTIVAHDRGIGQSSSDETRSCTSPTSDDEDGMTATVDDFHQRIAAHDWARAAFDESRSVYHSLSVLEQSYGQTIWSLPIILNINKCRLRVAVHYLERGKHEMCLEEHYEMEYSHDAHPRWIIRSMQAMTRPLLCV